MGVAGKHFPSHAHDSSAQDPGSTPQASAGPTPADERMRREPWFGHLLGRPEFAAISGTVLIFAIFAIGAGGSGMFDLDGVMNWSQVAAYLGILAVGACLLMIAGEFDLSIGSMIGFAGMMVAIPTMYFHWPISLSILFAFAGCVALGALNGYLVMRTRLPSFIVTLAFLFILRGLTLALSIMFADRTIVSGVGDVAKADWLTNLLFHGTAFKGLFVVLAHAGIGKMLDNGQPLVPGVPKVLLWWFALTAIGAFVLARTRYGNWILAVGGDANAAKNVGVPVKRVKISLFMLTAFCSCLFAVLQVCDIGSAAADRGIQKEFEAIIAAVIGGTLLTGGYGSVIGAAFGALIFGVVQIGITYTNIDSDWFRVFLGMMLLMAVLFNHYVRRRVAQS
ncbi:MAG: ABC transporter permease [Paraburkholderia sp.]|uniref:ABC transporter permease n=1 Tax=Paraburkholderia sp. TaxID=1926495 RepID=UPI001213F9B0|nr:ABC transporter permease [Paraburkholderia sp.]TAM07899.1 MAG: ABC transporter permease [Paraburkholderia sp.]TAM29031.1 MAG: ABC transporter permease [Paraburkholderia sp.]